MLLRHDIHGAETASTPLLIAHGLLGAARNWSAIAKRLAHERRVIVVDMRNHGDSPWDEDTTYAAMAADLAETIDAAAGGYADVVGHSMGGKAAMALAVTSPERVGRLVVADIAPLAYGHSHSDTIAAMASVDLSAVSRRGDADRMMADRLPDPAMRAFVAQNLAIEDGGARWRPNLAALDAGMADLVGWPETLADRSFDGPTLFLRGGASDYVPDEAAPRIRAMFPESRIATLEGAGHWLHAERPGEFIAAVKRFLSES